MLNLVKVRKNLSSKMLPRFHFLFSPCPEFDKEPFYKAINLANLSAILSRCFSVT